MRIKGRGIGYWFNCGDRNLSNQAPTATGVAITGSKEVGETVTCDYTYNDVNGDLEGTTTFEWWRADDSTGTNEAVIAGETGDTYLIAAPDLGKYIQARVTPVALTGTTPGTESPSSWDQVPYGYYIKTGGNDGLDGESDTNAWATIAKLNTEITAGNIDMTVYLNKGDTWMETLDTDGEDNITISAYGSGNDPVISGIKTLADSWVNEGSNVWSYTDATITGHIRNVIGDSSALLIGRRAIGTVDSGTDTTLTDATLTEADDYWNGAELYCRTKDWRWENRTVADFASGVLTIAAKLTLTDWAYNPSAGEGYYLQNHLNLLNSTGNPAVAQGDWYYDYSNTKLYMYSTQDPWDEYNNDIQVSTLDRLAILDSSDNIEINNIKIEYANEQAIMAYGTSNSTFDTINFSNNGHDIDIGHNSFGNCDNNTFTNITTDMAGHAGITTWHCASPTFTDYNGTKIGTNPTKYFQFYYPNTNYLNSVWTQGFSGITINNATDVSIDYVNIDEVGYCGIHTSYTVGFDYNYIYVKEANYTLSDGGGIYFVSNTCTSGNIGTLNTFIVEGGENNASVGRAFDGDGNSGLYTDRENSYIDLENGFVAGHRFNLNFGGGTGVGNGNYHLNYKNIVACAADDPGATSRRGTELAVAGYGDNKTVDNVTLITVYKSAWSQHYGISHKEYETAGDTFYDNMKILTPTGYGLGIVDNWYESPHAYETVDQFKAHTAYVGKHVQGNLLEYSMTGLSDESDMIWYATNGTKIDNVAVSFPANYYYYDVDGNLIHGATGADTLDAYEGKAYLRTIEEGLPEASSVEVSGTLFMGHTLTGGYSFDHAEGNDEGITTFQWYRSNDFDIMGRVAISGATSQNYITTSSDIGKYLIFGVTPVALTPGAGTGTLLTGVERFAITSSQISTI